MLGKVNKKALLGDIAKVATFNLVAHFLMHLRFNEPLFSEKFIYSLVFILLGFATYHYLLDNMVNAYFDKKAEPKKDAEKVTETTPVTTPVNTSEVKKDEEKKKETYSNYSRSRITIR